jgi:hypothetical protein
VLGTIGALTRQCLSTIAHVDPAVAMLPIRNRAGWDDRFWHNSEVPPPVSNGRFRVQSGVLIGIWFAVQATEILGCALVVPGVQFKKKLSFTPV